MKTEDVYDHRTADRYTVQSPKFPSTASDQTAFTNFSWKWKWNKRDRFYWEQNTGKKKPPSDTCSEFVDSVAFQVVWGNRSGKRARGQGNDFLFSICPCCEDMMFLQPFGAFIAQPGPKHNLHTDRKTWAAARAAHRPPEKPGLAHGLPLYTSSQLCVFLCDRFQCTDTDNSPVIVCQFSHDHFIGLWVSLQLSFI